MRSLGFGLVLAAMVGSMVPVTVAAQQGADGFRWSGRLAEGKTLEIKGVNGPILVEPSSGSQIKISTEAHGHRSDPSTVRIVEVESDDGLTFCALYPTPSGRRENECAPGSGGRMNTSRNDVEVTFHVRLPSGPRFRGRTVNGRIEAEHLSNDVDVSTVNGDIHVSTSGFADATTVNGSIDAALGRADPTRGLRFKTVNGSITLDVPDDLNADVDAHWVNGGLDTSLPLTLKGRLTRQAARGALGSGGPTLSLSTVNGSIRLR